MKPLFSYLVLISIFCIKLSISQQECSATASYLQITYGSQTQTLPSTKSLFFPYSYYIPSTEIISLPSSNADDLCDQKLTINVANKMVLLYPSTQCKTQFQVYILEQNAAAAVIVASTSSHPIIDPLPGSSNVNTTIPTRQISQDWANWITNKTENGVSVEGEFGCNDISHPLMICVLDIEGMHWFLDGDYILQVNKSYNQHPYWHKKGYYLLNYYIFLHVNNNTNEWFWAITADKTFQDDLQIMAYCNSDNQNISEPSYCPQWNTTDYYNTGRLYHYSINEDFAVSAETCNIADRYICIQSNQSSLAGLQGTYRLYNKNIPFWFREIDDCDSTPGILRYQRWDGWIKLLDAHDYWTVAQCNTNWTRPGYNYSRDAYYPQDCSTWQTLVDFSLDQDTLVKDTTMSITEGQCEEYECVIDEEPPETLCLSKNSVLHSFLEGTYVRTGAIGPNLQSVEYAKKDVEFDRNGNPIKAYLWYWGEFTDESTPYNWWILSPQNLSFANSTDGQGVHYWGYVACSLENVAGCQASWNFYWSVTGASHSDATFTVTEGDCPQEVTTSPAEYDDEYEYVCIDIVDKTAFSELTTLDPYELIGAYVINRTVTESSISGGIPHWTKPFNDYIDTEMYIYYDDLFGHWQIGNKLHNDTIILCMSNTEYPELCDGWYDTVDGKQLNDLLKFRVNDCSEDDLLRRSCSAMHSWLQLSGDGDDAWSETATSVHTLFPPYAYYVKKTEIVTLNVDNDDPCDVAGIETDISGKILLLFTGEFPCSDQYQLYVAGKNNASAVIMGSSDGTIAAIERDDTIQGLEASIPMRGVSLYQGIEIRDKLIAGETVYGEFKCNDSFSYPLTFCASSTGIETFGNYEYQEDLKMNEHPVWKRKGYSIYSDNQDLYLFLHTADGMLYWAMTLDPKMKDDDYIVAYCALSNNSQLMIDPSYCLQWNILDFDSSDATIYNPSDMILSDSLCNVTDNYFCLESNKSSLAGLSGTYRLYYDSEPIWFREWDDCDTHPAIFRYINGVFFLIDPMDGAMEGWIIARCSMGYTTAIKEFYDEDEFNEKFAFRPELCKNWQTLIDGSLDGDVLDDDETLNLTVGLQCKKSACRDNSNYQPNRLCFKENSVMHSFLEGSYVATGIKGEKYGTKEYVRSDRLYYGNEPVDVYLYWYGELSTRYEWWVMAAHNMSKADQQNYSLVYGYSACTVKNPANCRSWNFYWSGGRNDLGAWHHDPQFGLSDISADPDSCVQSTDNEYEYDDVYDYLCVDIDDEYLENNQAFFEFNLTNIFKGGYKINRTKNQFSEYTPYWIKPPNDYFENETYIYYDEFYGYWLIGDKLKAIFEYEDHERYTICMRDTPYPDKCNEWYDEGSNGLSAVLTVRSVGCTSSDVLTITKDKKRNVGAIVGLVIVIIIAIGLCIGGWWLYRRVNNDESDTNIGIGSTDRGNNSGRIKTKKGHQRLDLEEEDEDDDDDHEHERGTLTGVTSGGYDMSPLHRNPTDDKGESFDNDNSDHDEDEGEDDDDHDRVGNDIDDGEDGILMTKY